MPTWDSLADFGKTLKGLEGDLTGDEQRAITKAMARSAAAIAIKYARQDLGSDAAFSGRPNQSPISPGSWKGGGRELSNLKIRPGRDNVHWMFPTKKSGGPWKVAQQGRHQGTATGKNGVAVFHGPSINRSTGETFRTKTGNVRQTRTRRRSRWNGTTQGKNTATDAVAEMNRRLPTIADKAVLSVTRKRFDVT